MYPIENQTEYVYKLMRTCKSELNEIYNITEAKVACDNDQKCSYLSTNENCERDFKLCNDTHVEPMKQLKYSKDGCTLQKGS